MEPLAFQSVFQQIIQERSTSGGPRAQPLRRERQPCVAAVANIARALPPQEREEREREERQPLRAPTRSRPAAGPRAPGATGEDSSQPSGQFGPLSFTSFWTGLATMAAFSWTDSPAVLLAALGMGVFAGTAVERWLRHHRRAVQPPAHVPTPTPAPAGRKTTPRPSPPARGRGP